VPAALAALAPSTWWDGEPEGAVPWLLAGQEAGSKPRAGRKDGW